MNNKNVIENEVLKNNQILHAYLLEVDDLYTTEFSIAFVKEIIKHQITDEKILDEIFKEIDNKIFPDLKVIRPDGKQIKKDQILELLSEYKNTSIQNMKRFYIIEYAENLNQAAANSMLKFLEEPEGDIVAILITKNKYNILETILSRCQVVNLTNYYSLVEMDNLYSKALEYAIIVEQKKEKSLAYLNELYQLKADDLKLVIKIWINIYEKTIMKKIGFEETILDDNDIGTLLDNNDINNLVNKINLLNEIIKYFDYNVNSKIILDKLLLGGVKNEC